MLKNAIGLCLLSYCTGLFVLIFFLSQFKLGDANTLNIVAPTVSIGSVQNVKTTVKQGAGLQPKNTRQTFTSRAAKKRPAHKAFSHDTIEPERKRTRKIPNFSSFVDTNKKKQAFITFFKEIIDEQNALQLKRKEQLTVIVELVKSEGKLSTDAIRVLDSLLTTYRIPSELELSDALAELQLRINAIPGSMILAQAASESAWGTSRFARKANNFFGQWCFKKGCGIVPSRRKSNAKHEIAIFKSAESSVRAYFKNLNTYKSYKEFRLLRHQLENQDKRLKGLQLVEGLKRYSERGKEYINDLQQIIRFNQFDELFGES